LNDEGEQRLSGDASRPVAVISGGAFARIAVQGEHALSLLAMS
jgi:hypothetical protein